MNARARIALTIVLALAAVLLLSATPAWAVSGPVPGDPVINGRHLGGLTDTEARSAIQTASAVPKLGYVYLKAKGLPFAFDATKTIVVDVDATLIHAYDATVVPSYELTPTLKVSGAAPAMVTKWVLAIAKKVDGPAVNSRYYVRYRRLACITARNGGYLYWRTAIGMVLNLLKKEAAMGGAEQPRLNLPMSIIKPRVTSGNIQKAILVVLGDRNLFLYQGTRQLKILPVRGRHAPRIRRLPACGRSSARRCGPRGRTRAARGGPACRPTSDRVRTTRSVRGPST